MNENYLWDRTGEPDPEIQELEDVLGTLRYQPRRLAIPVASQPRRRSFSAAVAIAASIILMLLAAGLWMTLHRRTTGQVAVKDDGEHGAAPSPSPTLKNELTVDKQQAVNNDPTLGRAAADHSGAESPHSKLVQSQNSESPSDAKHSTRRNLAGLRRKQLMEKEREEAAQVKQAKEQLMLALRLASAKLNVAQRKAQGAPLPNVIRNQHKIG